MNVPKTCILCKYISFDAGEPDYSEVTPGSDWQALCYLNHWRMEGHDVTQDEYVENMLRAERCVDFKMSEAAEKLT